MEIKRITPFELSFIIWFMAIVFSSTAGTICLFKIINVAYFGVSAYAAATGIFYCIIFLLPAFLFLFFIIKRMVSHSYPVKKIFKTILVTSIILISISFWAFSWVMGTEIIDNKTMWLLYTVTLLSATSSVYIARKEFKNLYPEPGKDTIKILASENLIQTFQNEIHEN